MQTTKRYLHHAGVVFRQDADALASEGISDDLAPLNGAVQASDA